MSSLFTSSLSAMNAAHVALTTTQHNIANASTPGFTRQEVLVTSNPAHSFGGGFIGQGVNVSGVQRVYDQFLSTQVLQEQAQARYLTTYHSALKQVDNLVADPTAGASAAMRDFFSAMNGVANNPESIPARQTLLSNAEVVANRFKAIDQRLTDIANGLNSQVTSSVNSINSYAQQIAALNGNIKRGVAAGQGQQPNDLLDQRDALITKLNQEVKTSTLRQPDGTMSVFIGNGQTLVVDEQAMSLRVMQSTQDPSKLEIAYQNNNTTVMMKQSSLQGGNIGAFLDFRDKSLEPMRSELGRVALGMAVSVNQQNQAGLDLRGAMGGPLFDVAAPRVDVNGNNQGNAIVSARIDDIDKLTTSDYRLTVNGVNNYTLVRLSDNFTTNIAADIATSPQTVDGFAFNLASGTAKVGDSFLIRPTANAARDIAVVMGDPAKIAAAAPMRATATINATARAATTTVASGAISGTLVSGTTTTAAVGTFTVDGKTLFTNTIAAGSTGTLITGAALDAAWPGFAAANAGYTLTGSFAAGTAQIAKADGTPIVLAEVNSGGAGGSISAFAAGAGFMGTTQGLVVGTTITAPNNANLTNPVAITFTSPTAYTVTGAVPAVVGEQTYNPASPTISYNGWTLRLNSAPSSAPVAGDVINVGANSGAAKVSSGSVNLNPNPVSITFNTPATTYNVTDTGTVPPTVLGSNITYVDGDPISYNGWTAQISGTPAAGDIFNVTKNPNTVGTASMSVTPAPTNATPAGATITGGALSWTTPFSIIFDAEAQTYTVTGAIPDVSATPISYTPGSPIAISYNGWTAEITGTPADGDVFNFDPNTNATGDNRNALLLAGLQNRNVLANGTASLQAAYGQLVGQVGAKTNELAVTSEAQNNMVAETIKAQQSISGVNLDEEAANLIRFQRAYEAAAKAMQISNTMFDAVLALGR